MPSSADLPKPILTLENNITVRLLHLSDAESHSHQANNRKIWLNMTDRFPHPYTLSDSEWWINHCNDPSNFLPTTSSSSQASLDVHTDKIPCNYAICLADSPIGSVGLQASPNWPHALNMGYWLGEDHWGRGIATIVAKAFLKWTFDTFPWCVRVGADAYSWNPGSMKVLRKIGLEYEGRQKLAVCRAGKYCDLVLFGTVRPGFVAEETANNRKEV